MIRPLNGLLFLLPFVLVSGVGIYQDATAQSITSYRGESFLDVTNQDGTHTQTIGLSPFITTGELDQYGRTVYTHYIVDDQPTYVKIQNGEASFVFDKTTCSAQIYSGGLIGNNTSVISSDSFVPKSSVDGSGTWSVVTSVNNAACVVEVTQTADSIEVSGTKTSAAGIFKVRYVKTEGLPLKTILEATNLSGLTDRRFGVTQTQSIPQFITFGGQERDLADYIGQTFDRIWLENNKANLMKLSGGLSFNVVDAWSNLESISVNSVNNGMASVSFNYLRNTPILLPNETLIIDPTYSSNNPTTDLQVVDDGNNNVCATGSNKQDGGGSLSARVYTTAQNPDDCVRAFLDYDISSIPDTATITDVDFKFEVTTVLNPPNCDYVSGGTTRASDTAANIFTAIGSGTVMLNADSTCTTTGTDKSVDFGSVGDSEVTSRLAGDFFTFGIKLDNETIDATDKQVILNSEESASTPDPTLEITYVVICTSPTLTSIPTQSTSSIIVNWSQPSPNCSPTNYKVFESKNSAAYTLQATLGNVTTTTINSLDSGTQYSYKLSAGNGAGYGTNSTVGTNATLPIAPTSLSPSTYSQTRIDVTYSDGSQPNVSWYKSRYTTPTGTWINFNTNSSVHTPRYENFTGLTWGTQYNFAIASGTLGGWGAWSSNSSGTTTDGIVYSSVTPTNLIVYPDPPSGTKLDLQWIASAMQNINGYRILREAPVGGGFSTIVSNTTNTNIYYNNTGLSVNTYYNYKVYSLNQTGLSGASNTYSQTTYHLPDVVDDLSSVSDGLSGVDLSWTQPNTLYGYLTGYNINYTTPQGNPTTILVNSTGDSDVTYDVDGLDPSSIYSFRVSAITIHGKNITGGNIINATAFNAYEIGSVDVTAENTNTALPIYFEIHEIDADTSDVQVFYDPSRQIACDFDYVLGNTNQTYSNLTENVDGDLVYSNFTINGINNDIVDIDCWDELDTTTRGQERIGQNNIPLFDQVTDFQSGIYGTGGSFGSFDFMTLIIVILSMIAFNRTHPYIGVIGMFAFIGFARYFGLIGDITLAFGLIMLIVAIAIAYGRRDSESD